MRGVTVRGGKYAQTTLMLPFLSTAICASDDKPKSLSRSLERFCGVNVAPPSLERAKKMSKFPLLVLLSCQITSILPTASRASRALDEERAFLETFVGGTVAPPALERAKKMSVGSVPRGKFSSQDTLILPPASSASCGAPESRSTPL